MNILFTPIHFILRIKNPNGMVQEIELNGLLKISMKIL